VVRREKRRDVSLDVALWMGRIVREKRVCFTGAAGGDGGNPRCA
jgi:hypothetical protein